MSDRNIRIAFVFPLLTVAAKLAGLGNVSYIEKKDDKYCVKSEKNPNWNGGCYKSKEKAKKRLQQIEMFKHMKKSSHSFSLEAIAMKMIG